MKAITLWQPWASLIADGTKTIETRSWAPPSSLLGQRIAIHAALFSGSHIRGLVKSFHPAGVVAVEELAGQPGRTILVRDPDRLMRVVADYPLGVVVATARLTGFGLVSARIGRSDEEVYVKRYHHEGSGFVDVPVDPYGDFSPGRWLWFLEDVQRVDPPVPAKGRQGFWNWEAA